jgi:hypothetical protein
MFASHIYKNSGVVSDPNFNNVSLLLHGDGTNGAQNNTFLDSSTNNFTITRNGTPTQGSFSPYALNGVAYSPTLHGGSAYFPGVNSNYLSVPSNAAFNFTSGTFTVESLVMFTNLAATYQNIISNYNSSSTGWYVQTYLNKFIASFSGDGIDIQGTTTIIPNVWYHVAVSGSAGSYKLFVNGTQEGATYTGATSLAGGNLGIGAYGDRSGFIGTSPISGYISNARIVNGRACYTSNFTQPTSPVTLLSNGGATPSTAPTAGQVALLCDFTNAGIFDNAAKNNLLTVGNARVSTAQKKFGSGSMYFDGTDDRLTMVSNQGFAFGTSNFTVECWINPNQVNTGELGWLQTSDVVGGLKTTYTTGIICFFRSLGFAGGIGCNVGGTGYISVGGLVSVGNWYHFAVTRNSGNVNVWLNGASVASGTGNTNNLIGTNLCVGGYYDTSYLYNGYIDDLRITKGIARYTANFTPPTQAFPNL